MEGVTRGGPSPPRTSLVPSDVTEQTPFIAPMVIAVQLILKCVERSSSDHFLCLQK